MGLRATSIKEYKIEYGDKSGFNYDNETLANIIQDFCEDFYCGGENYANTDVIWEVDKEQYANMVKKIEEMDDETFNLNIEQNWQIRYTNDDYYTKDYVVKTLKGFLEDTPNDSAYVRIGWV